MITVWVDADESLTSMNAIAEVVIRAIRREVLDHFVPVSEKPVRDIVSEYVDYYNRYRPNQTHDKIPDREDTVGEGGIVNQSILSRLHHHYYRSIA